MSEIKPGRYRHFKRKDYDVLGVGHHSETLEELVFYRALYDDPEFGSGHLWVRPKKMFLEKITRAGKKVPRFEFLTK